MMTGDVLLSVNTQELANESLDVLDVISSLNEQIDKLRPVSSLDILVV
jgi:hypothetical protein